jgi:hypothetical protein
MTQSPLFLSFLSFLLSLYGCTESRRAQVPDGGRGRPDSGTPEGDGGPALLRSITCDGETGDGRHRIHHQVLRYADGSATSTCSLRGAEGSASGTGSYYYGETGQPGGDCFVELAGVWWRLSLAQDEVNTIITQQQAWLVPCHVDTT